MIAAAACVAAPLPSAMAQDHGRGRDRGERTYERQRGPSDRVPQGRGGEARRWDDRRGPAGDERRGDARRYERPRYEGARYADENRRPRWDDDDRGPRPAPREESRRRYEERPPAAPSFAPSQARRGGYLPDRFRGGVVEDYRRYRLRPPPHGYAWVRVGNGFALVSQDTGQIFDVIPD